MSHPTHEQHSLIDDRDMTPYHRAFSIVIETPRHGEILKGALEVGFDKVTSLAKANDTSGYKAAARIQRGDASVIKDHLLPQLVQQLTLRSPEFKALKDRVSGAFLSTIERALRDVAVEAVRTGENRTEYRYELGRTLAEELGERVASFAAELYEKSYYAGISERVNTFESLADHAASLLEL